MSRPRTRIICPMNRTAPGLSYYDGIPQIQTTKYEVTTPDGKIIPRLPGGFAPFFPKTFFGSGGYESPASLKKAFAAYGISSDINIKTLPTYSRYSAGTDIFKSQTKEDKRIQEMFYGKPKRSKSKKKTTHRKKSRKR